MAKLKYIEEVSADPRDWAAFAANGFGDMTVNISINPSKRETFFSRYRNILLAILTVVIAALVLAIFTYRKKSAKTAPSN